MGCGGHPLPGYINMDLQSFPGVDLVTDLSRPHLPQGATEVFSNAFYEHLFLPDRIPHLRAVYKSLAYGGIINYMGIPWFPGIVDAYVNRKPGTMGGGSTFDLYHVYRYTHGAPDEAGEYMPQLHKGLFDLSTFEVIFDTIKPDHATVYTYVYPDEPVNVSVTCGVFICKGDLPMTPMSRPPVHTYALEYLEKWDDKYIELSTVRFQ